MENGVRSRQEVLEQVKARLQRAGVDVNHVQMIHVNTKKLREAGVLLSLSIHGLTMFEVKVDWTHVLGILAEDERRTSGRLRPGRLNLLPDTKLQSIGQRARHNLATYSIETGSLGNRRLVPDKAFMAFWEKHQSLVQEMEDYKAWLIANRDDLLDQAVATTRKMAAEAWESIKGRERDVMGRRAFQNAAEQYVLDKFPGVHRIEAGVRIILSPPATFLLEAEYEQELLEAARLQAERQKVLDEQNYWRRQEKASAEAAEAEAKATKTEAAERQRVAREQALLEIETARQKEAAIRKAQLEMARQAAQDLVNPFLEVVQSKRAEIYEAVRKLSQAIHKRGWVHGKEAEAIRRLRENFAMLNIANDTQLDAALEALAGTVQERAEGPGQFAYDQAQVLSALGNVASVALQDAQDVVDGLTLDAFSMMDL